MDETIGALRDPYGRKIEYLRVSITDLCDFRCVYCRPPEGVTLTTHDQILRYEEILRIVELSVSLGVKKIRVTGGEPLVRKGVTGFIKRLTKVDGIEEVALTTNGYRLAPMAEQLKRAGLTHVNISLDSLNRETFQKITGKDGLENVFAGIDASLDVGFDPVKINVVLLKGFNEADTLNFAIMTIERPVDVRFIERMPFGEEHLPMAPDSFSALVAQQMIQEKLGPLEPVGKKDLDGPARMFRLSGAQGNIGFIDPVTGHFCATCNRLRLTAKGALRPCLFSNREINIKDPMRNGGTDEELRKILKDAVAAKPIGHGDICGPMGVGMNQIGG